MARSKKPDWISQKNWDDVDSPPLTDDELARLRPAREALPSKLYAALTRRGPGKKPKKELISIRLDPEIVRGFKEEGPGWQGRMNEALRRSLVKPHGAAAGRKAAAKRRPVALALRPRPKVSR